MNAVGEGRPPAAGRDSSACRIALVIAGTVVGLLAAEIALRLFSLAPEVGYVDEGRFRLSANPRIGYEMIPFLVHPGGGGRYDFHGPSNSMGFRDREHSRRARLGTYRILVLGDSIGEGLRVEEDGRIFPAVLETRLRGLGLNAEVLNFSVNGYNTLQEVELLKERGLDFAPDLVLVEYCLNDTSRIDGGILATLRDSDRSACRRSVNAARLTPWLGESALYRFLRYRVFAPDHPPADDGLLNRDSVEEALSELHGLAEARGFAVLLAVFPRLDALEPYPFRADHALVRSRAVRHGFSFEDLLPAFLACAHGGDGPVGFDAFHPTERGHDCAARALADEILVVASGQTRRASGP
jgi:hypothetical protein